MFRKLLGVGLLVLLLTGIFGGFGSRTRAAYYEGYADGIAQVQAAEDGAETAVPAAPRYRPHFFGWGILGIFAFFFKIGFFFLLAMIFMRLLFGRRRGWGHGPWEHGPWAHKRWRHHKHGPHHKQGRHGFGPEKGPKWMDDDDDEPIMTI